MVIDQIKRKSTQRIVIAQNQDSRAGEGRAVRFRMIRGELHHGMNLFACDAKSGAQYINTGLTFTMAVAQTLGATVESAERSALQTFAVIPKRWVIERSFAG